MLRLILLSVISLCVIVKSNDLSGFDDSVLHIIKWPGAENIDVVFFIANVYFLQILVILLLFPAGQTR